MLASIDYFRLAAIFSSVCIETCSHYYILSPAEKETCFEVEEELLPETVLGREFSEEALDHGHVRPLNLLNPALHREEKTSIPILVVVVNELKLTSNWAKSLLMELPELGENF